MWDYQSEAGDVTIVSSFGAQARIHAHIATPQCTKLSSQTTVTLKSTNDEALSLIAKYLYTGQVWHERVQILCSSSIGPQVSLTPNNVHAVLLGADELGIAALVRESASSAARFVTSNTAVQYLNTALQVGWHACIFC